MQNADRESVRPTATLNNSSHRATAAAAAGAKHASMGLGVSSTGGVDDDDGPGRSASVGTDGGDGGRFASDGREDDGSDGHMWKFERAKAMAESCKAKGARLKLNLIRRGVSPQIDDEDDALQSKSSELTRMISDDQDYDNDQNDYDQINDAILLAKAGDIEAVHLMLKQSGDVSGLSESDSYLCLAAAAGSFDLCQALLSYGASVDDRGSKGDCTPLMEASSVGDRRVVQLLCDKGADVNAKSLTGGNSPLHFAACNGNDDVVQTLLKCSASIEEQNENGHTPLMDAANTGHISTVRLLLDAGANINAHSNEFKETALTLAAYKGHVEMVDFLLKNGADVEHKTDEMHTALMEAVMDGHIGVAKLLIQSGAKINMPEDSFESPLTLAASGGHTDLAKLLLSSGASIEEANDEGNTPLMEAVREGHLPLVQLLLEEGANPNGQTQTQETPLGFACKAGNTEIAANLISRDAILDQEAEDGHTALMKAAKAGHLSTVQYLVSKGADINKLSRNNDSALSLACTFGCMGVVEFLLKNGANPIHRLQEGSTVIIEAAKGGHTEVVNLLLTYTNSIQYQQIIPDEQELSQSSPSQTSLDDQTSRVPMQGLGNVVPPQDPTAYRDAQRNFSHVERQYAGGDRRSDSCILRDGDKICMYHAGHGGLCDGSMKNIPQSPLGSGCSSSDDDDDDDDDADDYEDEDGDSCEGEMTKHDLLIKSALTMSSTDLPAGWKFENFPELSLAAEHIANKQMFEKFPDLRRREQIENFIRRSISKKNANHQLLDAISLSSMSVKPTNEYSIETPEQQQQQLHNGFVLMSGDQKTCAKQTLAGAATSEPKAPPHGPACECTHTENVISQLKKKKTQIQAASVLHQWHGDDPLGQSAAKKQLRFEPGQQSSGARQQIQNRIFAKGNQMFGYDKAPAQRKLLKHDHSILESCHQPQEPSFHQCGGAAFHGDDKAAYQNVGPQQSLSLDIRQQKQQLAENCLSHLSGAAIPSDSVYNQYHQVLKNLQDPYQQELILCQMQQQQQQQLLISSEATIPNASHLIGDGNMLNSDGTAPVGGVDKGAQTLSPYPPQRLLPEHHHQQLIEPNHAVDGQGKISGSGVYDCCDASLSRPMSPGLSLSVVPGFNPLTEMVDVQTEVSHDSALSVACAGGFYDLASLLLAKGAKIELKDKKGLTPLLLASSAGFLNVVELLLNHGADIEAQSDRTKDTALSLASAGGRYDVIELLLKRGANKEHRNVSDYTPLSQAASGGYQNVIRLLLSHGAEINSRTGSKLGISPLMLAAMNGHTESVILLLDSGSDVNAQIETNRNTALTLACFQGRHEVVAVLADRKANLEHRAKTGLTPLMEAATGGYVEVGRVLLEKGADVGAAPVPSSRDTPLTIAADKGHYRFVELLLKHCAPVDVKNKKGATALWLAANGGHLEVVHLLVRAGADVDSQDNRKVSCLVAAFRKGHTRVIKWFVKRVTQFPADQECARYISSIAEAELLSKCKECSEIIMSAKELQAEEAEKNADSLLQELQQEKSLVEKKRAAKERKREKKRQKKKEKTFNMKDTLRALADTDCRAKESIIESLNAKDDFSDESNGKADLKGLNSDKDSDLKRDGKKAAKARKIKPRLSIEDDSEGTVAVAALHYLSSVPSPVVVNPVSQPPEPSVKAKMSVAAPTNPLPMPLLPATISSHSFASVANPNTRSRKDPGKSARGFAMTGIGDLDDFTNPDDIKLSLSLPSGVAPSQSAITSRPDPKTAPSLSAVKIRQSVQSSSVGIAKPARSGTLLNTMRTAGIGTQKKGQRKDENWKDASKKMRKIDVPARAVSRVIGRAGCNINAIREHSLARIDLDKLKTSDDAVVTIRGLPEQINQAAELVLGLIRESDKDIDQLIAGLKLSTVTGQAVPPSTWKNASKTTSSSSSSHVASSSAWNSNAVNVWENRTIKGGSVTSQSSTPSVSAQSAETKSSNIWSRPAKEQVSLSDLGVSSSNIWDNSMAEGIGTTAAGAKPVTSIAPAGFGKFPSQLGKQDGLDPQRPAPGDEYSRPQPIRSFPIGAWTPIRGHAVGSSNAAPERVMQFFTQPNPGVEAPPGVAVAASEVVTCVGEKPEQVSSSIPVASEESAFEAGIKAKPVSFGRSDPVENRAEGCLPGAGTGELANAQSMANSFPNPAVASEKPGHQFQDLSIGEYSPFNNHFSHLADSVIPKKVPPTSRITFPDMAALRHDAAADMALQAKAPGYRPPGQVQRPVSSPGLADQCDQKVAPAVYDGEHRRMATPTFSRTGDQPSPNLGDYSPFSDGIEKASKMVLRMNDGFCVGPPHSKPDAYITTQSPMMLPRVSSNLNPDAPNFSSRPPIFRPRSSFEVASMFSAPNNRPPMNMNLIHHPAGLAGVHAANGFISNSSMKDHLMAQSLGFSASASNNIDPSAMMRQYSLADESSQSGQQLEPLAAPSVSNPPLSLNDASQSNSSAMGDTPFRLRPIGTERTNKRPSAMAGPCGVMPNTGDLPPWTYSPGPADWQRQGYITGATMPLNIIPNLPQDGLVPQMSSNHHPAMIGHLPIPQQKILAVNNPMFDQSIQIRPNFLVPNGMALSYGGGGGGALAPHPSLQYPHLPPPSPAPDRGVAETQGSWTSTGLSVPEETDSSLAACDEERLRAWNIWNGPSNIQNSFL